MQYTRLNISHPCIGNQRMGILPVHLTLGVGRGGRGCGGSGCGSSAGRWVAERERGDGTARWRGCDFPCCKQTQKSQLEKGVMIK